MIFGNAHYKKILICICTMLHFYLIKPIAYAFGWIKRKFGSFLPLVDDVCADYFAKLVKLAFVNQCVYKVLATGENKQIMADELTFPVIYLAFAQGSEFSQQDERFSGASSCHSRSCFCRWRLYWTRCTCHGLPYGQHQNNWCPDGNLAGCQDLGRMWYV